MDLLYIKKMDFSLINTDIFIVKVLKKNNLLKI